MKTVGCGLALCFAAALSRAQPPAPVRLAPFGVPQTPGAIAVWNDLAFFAGTSPESGIELWKSDGTPAGTALITDFVPGPDPSGDFPKAPQEITPFSHGVAYSCLTSPFFERELCASDGTAAGTRLLADNSFFGTSGNPKRLMAVGDMVFYQETNYYDPPGSSGPFGSGDEPQRTDGLSGATRSWDLWIGLPGSSSSPADFTAVGDQVFFAAYQGDFITPPTSRGRELWVIDQNQARGVADIGHGAADISSWPTHLTAVGSRLLFSADDLVTGRELWRSDGTEAGTVQVRDIHPGSAGSIENLPHFAETPTGSTAVLGERMLFAADDGISGMEPWVSDGTEAGTQPLADAKLGPSGSAPAGFTRVGGRVFFHADDGVHGRELWVTDGTPEGTHMVVDAVPGASGSTPVDLVGVGTVLVYQASDPQHGQELWRSDGSAAGTFLLADLEPGPGSSNPQGIAANSTHVFFAAQTTTDPLSLYSLSRNALRTGLGFFTLPPCRAFDSRSGSPLLNGFTQTVAVVGVCGIPATAKAVAFDLTSITPTGAGFLRAYPSGIAPTQVSQVNFSSGQTRTNNGIVEIGADGKIVVDAALTGGAVDFVFDVVGYFE